MTTLAANAKEGLPLLHLAGALQKIGVEHRAQIATALASHGEFANDRALPLMIWYGLEPAVLNQLGENRDPLFRSSKLPHLRKFLTRRITEEIERRPADVEYVVSLLGPAGEDPA
ncbi:MAG: hypothetical protein NT069_19655, partial [Planctomycetota bacterium]|nr:hypothetical protein [Planctomycetota bacterium]